MKGLLWFSLLFWGPCSKIPLDNRWSYLMEAFQYSFTRPIAAVGMIVNISHANFVSYSSFPEKKGSDSRGRGSLISM